MSAGGEPHSPTEGGDSPLYGFIESIVTVYVFVVAVFILLSSTSVISARAKILGRVAHNSVAIYRQCMRAWGETPNVLAGRCPWGGMGIVHVRKRRKAERLDQPA